MAVAQAVAWQILSAMLSSKEGRSNMDTGETDNPGLEEQGFESPRMG
jgi:hypothetical protein